MFLHAARVSTYVSLKFSMTVRCSTLTLLEARCRSSTSPFIIALYRPKKNSATWRSFLGLLHSLASSLCIQRFAESTFLIYTKLLLEKWEKKNWFPTLKTPWTWWHWQMFLRCRFSYNGKYFSLFPTLAILITLQLLEKSSSIFSFAVWRPSQDWDSFRFDFDLDNVLLLRIASHGHLWDFY